MGAEELRTSLAKTVVSYPPAVGSTSPQAAGQTSLPGHGVDLLVPSPAQPHFGHQSVLLG